MRSYFGTLGEISAAGAEDYFEGSMHSSNMPRAAWKEGVVPNALQRQSNVALPFFPSEMTLFPLFDHETQLVAEELQLKSGEWYAAFEGEKSIHVLDSASYEYPSSPKETIEKLCFAAKMDTLGRTPYFTLLLQCTGSNNGETITKTAVFDVDEITSFSGAIAAITCMAVLDGEVKPGLHHTASIKNGDFFIDHLKEMHHNHSVQIIEESIEELLNEEEGVL